MSSFLDNNLSLLSVLLPLTIGMLQWKWLPYHLKLIFWVAVASISADLLSLLFLSQKITTWPLLNVFYSVHFSLLFFALGSERKIYFLRVLFWACIAFAALNFLFIQGVRTFNTYTSYGGGILMILSALSYFYWLLLLNELPAERVYRLPLFWVAFGTLIYFGGTLFLFLFNNYVIVHLPKSHKAIWILHNLLNITKNVFLFAAIWTHYRNRTSPP